MSQKVLVTGGAGYVGAALVPKLLERGYEVVVLDLYLYGREALDGVRSNPRLTEIEGDLRDPQIVERALAGVHSVIHLACISNDPSFELDPDLGKSINLTAFEPLVQASRDAGVGRFVFASSSSVYGVKEEPEVDETLPLEPLTDYSRFKADCEEILLRYQSPDFTTVVVRPATVCGYSPRQRLDVIVNILTNHAYHNGRIKVFGGSQKRPNIHIEDMVDVYLLLLEAPAEKIAGKIFNAGYENHPVRELGELVRDVVGAERVEMETVPTDDERSYHISSEKIRRELGFEPQRTIEDAVRDLVAAFEDGRLPDAMSDPRYFNIRRMQERNLR